MNPHHSWRVRVELTPDIKIEQAVDYLREVGADVAKAHSVVSELTGARSIVNVGLDEISWLELKARHPTLQVAIQHLTFAYDIRLRFREEADDDEDYRLELEARIEARTAPDAVQFLLEHVQASRRTASGSICLEARNGATMMVDATRLGEYLEQVRIHRVPLRPTSVNL